MCNKVLDKFFKIPANYDGCIILKFLPLRGENLEKNLPWSYTPFLTRTFWNCRFSRFPFLFSRYERCRSSIYFLEWMNKVNEMLYMRNNRRALFIISPERPCVANIYIYIFFLVYYFKSTFHLFACSIYYYWLLFTASRGFCNKHILSMLTRLT